MITLLGAKGFIGRNISSTLAHKNSMKLPGRDEASLDDKRALRRCIEPGSIVINAAGYAQATDSSKSGIERFQRDNVEGVRNLVEVCAEVGVLQLIHISSVAAMGPWTGENISELMMIKPETPYAMSKLAAEQILAEFHDRLAITILRPTSVFGPGRELSKQLCRIARLPFISLPARGMAKIPFTDVANVVEGVRICLQNPNSYGKTFIVGDSQSYLLREIVAELSFKLGKPCRFIELPDELLQVLVFGLNSSSFLLRRSQIIDRNRWRTISESVSYSTSFIRSSLNYKPVVEIHESIAKLANFYLVSGMK
jgi:dihydroflavonol-4-reductase